MDRIGRTRVLSVGSALLALVLATACGGGSSAPFDPANVPTDTTPTARSVLNPEAALVSECYDWPARAFTSDWHASGTPSLEGGDAASDFVLRDVDGTPHRLADLLGTKPVLLVLGAYTCKPYRLSVPQLNALAERPYDATRTYADVCHIVSAYVIEPHPMAPDVSPYIGVAWELKDYSLLPQAYTYEGRVDHARRVQPLLTGNQLLLVDDLGHDGRINPVWCSYGPAANAAYLIGTDGRIEAVQPFFEVEAMRTEIDRLLGATP